MKNSYSATIRNVSIAFLYGMELSFFGLIRFRNRREAYLNISFEKEVYQNEKTLTI